MWRSRKVKAWATNVESSEGLDNVSRLADEKSIGFPHVMTIREISTHVL